LHGIQREKRRKGPASEDAGVTRIVLRYSDGRVVNFVPDAGRETFSEDDILELQKMVDHASATAEWADINTRLGF
jgi:hypothetical protein